jgi:hypothetical protein
VITGFNTDIEHDGVVYHVQTEDKGLETPLILSLVYSGGAILASKRARYEDLIASGFSDEALSERLTRQHKLICAAIHAGRIEDLKRMSASPVSEAPSPPGATQPELEAEPQPELEAEPQPELEAEPQPELEAEPQPELEAEAQPELEAEPQLEILRGEEEREALQANVFDAGQDKPSSLEAEANFDETADLTIEEKFSATTGPLYTPEPISEQQDQRRQSVMGELPASTDGLRITLLGRQEFRSGESPIVKVLVGFRTGIHETPIAKAAVSVKVLGTTFRPQLYSAKTTSDGVAAVATKIPSFTSGRAAILIRAVFNGQQTELRRVIHPGK